MLKKAKLKVVKEIANARLFPLLLKAFDVFVEDLYLLLEDSQLLIKYTILLVLHSQPTIMA